MRITLKSPAVFSAGTFLISALLACFLFSPFKASADTIITDDITADTTWDAAGSPYIVQNNISISPGATLSVEPGVIVKLDNFYNATTNPDNIAIDVFGNLDIQGIAGSGVIFTYTTWWSGQAQRWGTIRVNSGAVVSAEHAHFEYSGNMGSIVNGNAFPAFQNRGTLTVTESDFSNTHVPILQDDAGAVFSGTDIYFNGDDYSQFLKVSAGDVSVSHSTFANGGLPFQISGTPDFSFMDNTLDHIYWPGYMDAASVPTFTHSGNTFLNNSGNFILLSGELSEDLIFDSASEMPFAVKDLIVPVGRTLTIPSGFVLKFYPAPAVSAGRLTVSGTLIAQGTAAEPIYFTRLTDDAAGGATDGYYFNFSSHPYWAHIDFAAGSTGDISHAIFRDCDADNYCIANNGDLSFSHIEIKDLYGYALIQGAVGNMDIEYANIHHNNGGISAGGPVSVHNSAIYANTSVSAWNSYVRNGIRNESPLVTIDATGNWWGNPAGPFTDFHADINDIGESVHGLVNFADNCADAACTPQPPPPPAHDPVILIPGIIGSQLFKNYDDNTEIWPAASKLALSLTDSFIEDLALNVNGTENSEKPMILGDIIRSATATIAGINITSHIFDFLIQELVNNGYSENTDLFVFAYDWRKSTSDNAVLLKNKIDEVLAVSGSLQVDLVAHSMGGLLAKKYIADEGSSKVDQLIFVGTPHLGAPKAFKALMYGDNMGFPSFGPLQVLSPDKVKLISQNMPSVYELLPSKKYINNHGNYLTNNTIVPQIGLNYEATKEFMILKGRNPIMFPIAEAAHDDIDNLDLSNIETYNFIGCGTKTIGTIISSTKHSWRGNIVSNVDDLIMTYISGDETVPIISSDSINTVNKYYIDGITHAKLPSGDGVKEAIVAILTGETIPASPHLVSDVSACKKVGKVVSTHSPVTLHIYDEANNHTGPNADGDVEYGIDGVQYDIVEGENYAFLPDGVNYKVVTHATDTGGYNFLIEDQDENDVITNTYAWTLIPLATLQARGEIWVGPDHPVVDYAVDMDDDGDNDTDAVYPLNFDGTSLAEAATNPPQSTGGGGVVFLPSVSQQTRIAVPEEHPAEIRDITIDPLKLALTFPTTIPSSKATLNLPKSKPISVQSEPIEKVLKIESNTLTASAGDVPTNTRKYWIFACIGIFGILLVAKRFIKS